MGRCSRFTGLREVCALMKKLLLTSIAALFLVTGAVIHYVLQ